MIGNETREKCSSCGGDYYHYAGCAVGDHGQVMDRAILPDPLPSVPPEHKWDTCNICGPMVRCGYCGNNCCNGGSGDGCPDKCASAYEMQRAEYAAASSPLPSEPQKFGEDAEGHYRGIPEVGPQTAFARDNLCPTCGTKLIPAAQAFSEIRERITTEEPDDLHREARFLESASTRDYAKKHPDAPAEELPELKEALIQLQMAVRNANSCGPETDPSYGELYEDQRKAATVAIQALFDRQREEIERLYKLAGVLDSEQMEANEKLEELENHLKGDRVNADLLAQLERLKAEQLTAEEAKEVLWHINGGIHLHFTDADHDALVAKLRRHSDTGAKE